MGKIWQFCSLMCKLQFLYSFLYVKVKLSLKVTNEQDR